MSDAPAANGAAMQVDAGLVRQLAELLDSTLLTEIEVQDGDRRIRVARAVTMAAAPSAAMALSPMPAAASTPAPAGSIAQPAPALAAPQDHPGAVKSPMVGTVYLSPEPGAPGFVSEGAQVSAGATLLIVEAMKVMNPIVAPRAGRIARVLVENGQPVEFDQPLVVIE